jgi:hypothetical protein
MSEEKPKYIRKKCEHNKYKIQCTTVRINIYDCNNIKSIYKDYKGLSFFI